MRLVLLALLLLPPPAMGLTLEYELATRALDPCFLPLPAASDDSACVGPLSAARDPSGEWIRRLEGRLTLEVSGDELRVLEFAVEGTRIRVTGRSSGPHLPFSAVLLDASADRLEVLVDHDEQSSEMLEFDPKELLADLDRLDFIATFSAPLLEEGGCSVFTLVSRPPHPDTDARFAAAAAVQELGCEKALKDPEVAQLITVVPDRKIVDLHIVAIPLPEPAAILLLGIGVVPLLMLRWAGHRACQPRRLPEWRRRASRPLGALLAGIACSGDELPTLEIRGSAVLELRRFVSPSSTESCPECIAVRQGKDWAHELLIRPTADCFLEPGHIASYGHRSSGFVAIQPTPTGVEALQACFGDPSEAAVGHYVFVGSRVVGLTTLHPGWPGMTVMNRAADTEVDPASEVLRAALDAALAEKDR